MPRMIRILHVLHSFSAGGLENGIVNIINRSPEHFVHELCLLSTAGEFIDRLTRPVIVHEMNKKSGNSLRLVLQLHELFRKRKADIIHTRNWSAFDGVLAACLMPKPALIHSEHGRDMSDLDGNVYRRNLTRRLLAFRPRKFVAVSKDLYAWLKDRVHIPISKLTFIPNGVDSERFSPGREFELRKELGIGDGEFVVGAIGRLDPVKNHHGLIRAIQQLQKNGHPVRLVIVGMSVGNGPPLAPGCRHYVNRGLPGVAAVDGHETNPMLIRRKALLEQIVSRMRRNGSNLRLGRRTVGDIEHACGDWSSRALRASADQQRSARRPV